MTVLQQQSKRTCTDMKLQRVALPSSGAGLLRQVGRGGPADDNRAAKEDKQLGLRKLFQVLVLIDDFASSLLTNRPSRKADCRSGSSDSGTAFGRRLGSSS